MTQSEQIDELFTALSVAQGKIEGAKKDQKNPHFKSTFAGLSATWDACRQALSENGLAVVQTTMPTTDGIFLVTTLGHKSGQWIRGETPLFMDREGMQPLGSAITYARRYGLQGVTGIAPVDDDGESATDHAKPPVAMGPLNKTQLEKKLRVFAGELLNVEDSGTLAGLQHEYEAELKQCKEQHPAWWLGNADQPGLQTRIYKLAQKFAEQERTPLDGG